MRKSQEEPHVCATDNRIILRKDNGELEADCTAVITATHQYVLVYLLAIINASSTEAGSLTILFMKAVECILLIKL